MNGEIGVGYFNGFSCVAECYGIGLAVLDKAVGTLGLTNQIVAEIELLGNSFAVLGGSDGIYYLALLVMNHAIGSDDILGCCDFKLSTFKITFLEHGNISCDFFGFGYFLCRCGCFILKDSLCGFCRLLRLGGFLGSGRIAVRRCGFSGPCRFCRL